MSTQDLFAWCCPLSPAAGPTFSLGQWPCPVWPSPTTQALGSDLTAVACSPRPWCHQFLSPGHFYQHTNTTITQFEQCRPCPLRQASFVLCKSFLPALLQWFWSGPQEPSHLPRPAVASLPWSHQSRDSRHYCPWQNPPTSVHMSGLFRGRGGLILCHSSPWHLWDSD